MNDTVHLAINVYQWGTPSQNRLLVDLLRPLMEELYREHRIERFIYDRFDARGPHVFLALTASSAYEEEITHRLATELDRFLARSPSVELLSAEEIEARHAACRGKALCAADRLGGFAENNTYRIERHDERGYPFWIGQNLAHEEELWSLLTEQGLWSLRQLAACPEGLSVKAAIVWAAAFETALRRTCEDAVSYWRYHATTLLPQLVERLEEEREDEVAGSLSHLVSEKNRAGFERVWESVDDWAEASPNIGRLVEVLTPDRPSSGGKSWTPAREVVHLSLKQLGLGLRFQIPIVIFCWLKNLVAVE